MNIIHFPELVFLLTIYRVEKTIQNADTNTVSMCSHGSHWTPLFGCWIISLDSFVSDGPIEPSDLDKVHPLVIKLCVSFNIVLVLVQRR